MNMRQYGFLFRPMMDADNTASAAPATEPVAAPVATDADKLAKAKALLEGLEQLGLQEVSDLTAQAKQVVANLEAKAAAEVQVVEGQAVKLEGDAKSYIVKLIAAEKTFCEEHALSLQAVNAWVAVIGGIVLLKLLKVL